MMMNQNRYWDETLKPHLSKLLKEFDTTDKLSHHYLGQGMFYVEHDLADGRDPRFRLSQCQGVFKAETFRDIEEFKEFRDMIVTASEMIHTFMGLNK